MYNLTGADEKKVLVLIDCTCCDWMMFLKGTLVKSLFDILELLIDVLFGYNWQLVCVSGITKEIRPLPLWDVSGSASKL